MADTCHSQPQGRRLHGGAAVQQLWDKEETAAQVKGGATRVQCAGPPDSNWYRPGPSGHPMCFDGRKILCARFAGDTLQLEDATPTQLEETREEARDFDSCRFGSPHLKPFRFLGSHINLEGISKRCRCKEEGRVHIQVLHLAILAFRHEELSEDRVDGLEDQLVNEVMIIAGIGSLMLTDLVGSSAQFSLVGLNGVLM